MKWVVSIAATCVVVFIAAMILTLGFGVRDPFHGNPLIFGFMAALTIFTFSMVKTWVTSRTAGATAQNVAPVSSKTHTQATQGASPFTTSPVGRSSKTAGNVDDEPFYALAMKECEGVAETRKMGLWAKAFSLTDGDEPKAKAKYIALRVEQLKDELAKEEDRVGEQKQPERSGQWQDAVDVMNNFRNAR